MNAATLYRAYERALKDGDQEQASSLYREWLRALEAEQRRGGVIA